MRDRATRHDLRLVAVVPGVVVVLALGFVAGNALLAEDEPEDPSAVGDDADGEKSTEDRPPEVESAPSASDSSEGDAPAARGEPAGDDADSSEDDDVTFVGSAQPLPGPEREEMTGVSWHEDCPVHLDDLALLEVAYHDFDGEVQTGEMVVADRVAEEVLGVFESLFEAGFPIERMRRIDAYDGDDDASMEDNNSVAFNCRPVTGGSRWSDHAYGTAIDLNPVQNPYVRDSTVLPPAGSDYLDRRDERPGMIVRPGPVVEAFESIGWGWGGDWQSLADYMHFSESGR